MPDYANSYGEVQTGSGPDFPNVNYGVKFLKFDSDLVRGSATFRILHTPPLGWGGGHEIVGIWVKCPNFFWYLVPYGVRAHVLCYVFRVPPPSLHRDLAIQSVSLKVVTWSDFWPAAGEKFGDFRSPNPFEMRCFRGTNSRI